MNQSEMEAILKLYEAHFDPAAYQSALVAFASMFPDVRIMLQIEGWKSREFSLASVSANIDRYEMMEYAQVAHLNPLVDEWEVKKFGDKLFSTENWAPRADVRKTQFFNEYMKSKDEMDMAYGFIVLDNWESYCGFSATVPGALSEDDRSSLAASMESIRPHVQSSFRMVRELMQRTATAQTGSIIDRVGTPVAVFDDKNRLVVQNAKADELFRNGGVLSLSHQGTLVAREKKTVDLIQAAANKLTTNSLPVGPLRVSRPDKGPLILYFVPAGGAVSINPIVGAFSDGFPAYILYVLDPEDVDPAPVDVLTTALGLTPAEARLAQLLYEGNTVREAAEQSSTAYATARNQLGAISRKLNLNRQSELTGLLARLLARVPR
ncbi:helix-turn-helix transcriptional regulator [Amorphus sp. MBR-141]